MRKSLVAASLLALTVAVAPACATKKFVRTEVGGVNQKVDTLTGTVEETQERTRQNAERIGVVDQKAEAAGKSASAAQSAADAAAARATEANTARLRRTPALAKRPLEPPRSADGSTRLSPPRVGWCTR